MTTWEERVSELDNELETWFKGLKELKDMYEEADAKTRAKYQMDIISLELKLEESIILIETLFLEEVQPWKNELKEKYNEGIAILKERVESTKAKFEEFDEVKDDAWKDIKAGVDKSVKSLGEAIDKAKSRFKD
jgi:uncharacterized protein YukE